MKCMQNVNRVYSQLLKVMVGRWVKRNWETWIIQNIYFIEPQHRVAMCSLNIHEYAWKILITILRILFKHSALNHINSHLHH
jgi:hypothetical protein